MERIDVDREPAVRHASASFRGLGVWASVVLRAARVVVLGVPLLALACQQPRDALDIGAAIGTGFHCVGRAECWEGAYAAAAWPGLESPPVRVGAGATLVLRLRATGPVEVVWDGEGGPRSWAQLTLAKPWALELVALPLPADEVGRVRLSALQGRVPELQFAEVLRPARGRCYRDHARAAGRLRAGVACVSPASATLQGDGPADALRIATLAPTVGPSPRVVVRATGAGATQQVGELRFSAPGAWDEQRLTLPVTDAPARIDFEIGGGPGALARWSVRLVRPRAPTQRNVVLYLVDTLRPDALGTYGAERPTPHFDALAESGVVFEHAHAPASWTLPSVASLFTGRDAYQHGVLYGQDALPPDVTTLAERFRQGGYLTAAFTTSIWVSDRHGTHRGFDEVVDVGPEGGAWRDLTGTSSAHASAQVLPWLERHADEPFFLYVHVVDPHQPYTPPPALAAAHGAVPWPPGDPRWAHARAPSEGRGRGRLSALERMPPAASAPIIAAARGLYDAAVVHCDGEMGRLLDTLERRGVRAHTLVAVTADHGEEFMEHRLTGHAHSVYAEVTRVPLILSLPGALPTGARVRTPVGLVDVAPTLLGIAGLPVPASMPGADLQALALAPERGRAAARPLFLLHRPQSRGARVETIPDMDAVVDGTWKLIRNHGTATSRPEWELFDQAADPWERVNRSTEARDVRARLQALLADVTDGSALPDVPEAGEIDADTRDRLRALGYAH